MLRKLLRIAKVSIFLLGLATLSAMMLVLAVPDIKYRIYKALPPTVRWDISYALSDKFLIGMIYFVEKDDQLLLVKQSYQDKWGLPGGWLNKNESLKGSAQRELGEELGIELSDFEILHIRKVPNARIIDVAIRGKVVGEPSKTSDAEVESFRFFNRDALPEDIIRTHKPFVKQYLARQAKSNTQQEPQPQALPIASKQPAENSQ